MDKTKSIPGTSEGQQTETVIHGQGKRIIQLTRLKSRHEANSIQTGQDERGNTRRARVQGRQREGKTPETRLGSKHRANKQE